MKGRIYAPDLQYRYVFEVDVQRQKTNLEKTYEECWIKVLDYRIYWIKNSLL